MSKPFDAIFLDMDGVLSDFVGGVFKLFDRPDTLEARAGARRIEDVLGVDEAEMWEKIDSVCRFWHDLPIMPHALTLWDFCQEVADTVYVASQPSWNSDSAAQKLRWLEERISGGKPFRNYVLTPHKHLLARDRTLLIDDTEAQVDRFEAAWPGAVSLLYPAPYNRRCEDTFEHLMSDLWKIVQLAHERQ